jgi:transcriptional regulator with XRE-family HTH domain
MIIGSRIRQLREQRGITRDDIEAVSGLERSYIARIEQGRTVPPLEALERIAAALAVPLYWLFYAEDGSPTVPPAGSEPADTRSNGEVQLLKRLKEVSGAPFEADPAFLLEFARRTSIGKPEN